MQYKGFEWIKFNHDTGVVKTVLLVGFVEGRPLRNVGEFIVANGQDIRNFGRAKLQLIDEFVTKHKKERHNEERHKTICSCE